MNLFDGHRKIELILSEKDIRILKITFPTKIFLENFSGSGSNLLRKLKNGLYSIGKVSNRTYFKDFSGVYLVDTNQVTTNYFLIFNNPHLYSCIQMNSRVKKLTGINTQIDELEKNFFNEIVQQNLSILYTLQCFGKFYSFC